MSTTTKKPKEYVNNADFLKALTDYKEACILAKKNKTSAPPIPNYIGQCWMKIAEGLSHKPNFINYTYRDEICLLYTSPSPRDRTRSRMPSSA